jgi:hypothetical protein
MVDVIRLNFWQFACNMLLLLLRPVSVRRAHTPHTHVPAPHQTFDPDAIAKLKRKLQAAVAVANGYHMAL